MKKIVIVTCIILMIAQYGYAAGTGSCSQVKEKVKTKCEAGTNVKPDTIFQKLGDFMTGDYEVRGEPIKKTGLFQPVADEIERTKPAAVR